MTKVCSKCKDEKDVSKFYKDKKYVDIMDKIEFEVGELVRDLYNESISLIIDKCEFYYTILNFQNAHVEYQISWLEKLK